MSETTYAQKERHGTAFFIAGKENLLGGGFFVLGVAECHTLKDRAVQHDAQGTVSTHDHAAMLLSGIVLAGIDLESSHAALFPLAAEMEKLALAGEECLFLLLTSLDYHAVSVDDHEKGDSGFGRESELVCSKKRSSVLSASNVVVSSPSSLSLPSSPDSSAPIGFAGLGLGSPPMVAGALGDAKLVKPPDLAAAAKPPPTPAKPLFREPKPDVDVEPKLDMPEPDLNTDGFEEPREPKGEFSEPAKELRAEEAKVEIDAGFLEVEVEPPSVANGEEAAALANAL